MLRALLLTFFSGILGTVLGGSLSILFQVRLNRSLSALLAFSAGMMFSMICFDLLPEALENGGMLITVTGCATGVLLLLLLDGHFHHHHAQTTEKENLHHHEPHSDPNQKLIRLGFLMIGSVALHNFPEGLAIGSSSMVAPPTGILMAVLLTLHNLPEGMGMIAPLLSGGMNKGHALLLVALSGIPTVAGGILGAWLGAFSAAGIAGILSLAAGCMLYVTWYEILPQVQLMDSGKKSLLFQLFGFLLGFILIQGMH